MAPTRYKIRHRITSGGSRCPTCSSGREKTRGISASLGKSQLFDLERKVRKAPLKQKIDNFLSNPTLDSAQIVSHGWGTKLGRQQDSPARMSASSMKWVLNTVTRLAFLFLSRFHTMWREQGSIPAVGSSSSKTWGQNPEGFPSYSPCPQQSLPSTPRRVCWSLPVTPLKWETSQTKRQLLSLCFEQTHLLS